MSQSNSEPADTAPPSSGPEIITVHAINSDQQTPQDRASVPVSLPATLTPNSNTALRENVGVREPFASAFRSSARTGKSPLRQSSVASLDAGTPLPAAVSSTPQPASSNARVGPLASNAEVGGNLNASTTSRVQPAHQRLPGSSANVYASAMYSSPAPMSLAGSPLAALPQGFQPYPTAPPLPPSRPPPAARPFIPRSNNVYPGNQSSQSLDTSGMPPLISAVHPQSSPSYYPTYAASPYSRVDPTSLSANQRPSNMPPSSPTPFIPPLPSVPDLPSQGRGFYYASPAPMNMESYPPELPSSYQRPVYQKTPSRRPTLDAYVANDPFRAHDQRSTTPVDKNLTFDDIPLAPEDLLSSWRYATPSVSRPNAMAVPPGPVPVIPPWPSSPYGYSNDHNGIYRPTTGRTQSAPAPQPVIPDYDPPVQPPVVRVDPQRAESPPTYPPTGYPGHVVDTGLGFDPNHGGGEHVSPLHTSDPTQPTVIEVGEPEVNDSGSTAGDDQPPQPGRWDPDIPLIPVRRPTDDSYVGHLSTAMTLPTTQRPLFPLHPLAPLSVVCIRGT